MSFCNPGFSYIFFASSDQKTLRFSGRSTLFPAFRHCKQLEFFLSHSRLVLFRSLRRAFVYKLLPFLFPPGIHRTHSRFLRRMCFAFALSFSRSVPKSFLSSVRSTFPDFIDHRGHIVFHHGTSDRISFFRKKQQPLSGKQPRDRSFSAC